MKMLALLGLALGAVAAGRLAAHRWVAVTVRGDSMCPALADGDRVLLRRTPVHRLAVGDIVVVRLPGMPRVAGPRDRPWLIKRVAALPGDPVPSAVAPAVDGAHVPPNRLVLLSDNPVGAIDSRQFGYLTPDLVLGRVVRRLA